MADDLYPGVAGSCLSLLLGVVPPINQVQLPMLKLLNLTYLRSNMNLSIFRVYPKYIEHAREASFVAHHLVKRPKLVFYKVVGAVGVFLLQLLQDFTLGLT